MQSATKHSSKSKCVDCGEIRTLSYDTKQCHECEGAEREQELDAIDELLINAEVC